MAEPILGPDASSAPVAPDTAVTADESRVPASEEDRRSVYSRERAEYGGIKLGVAFFGWLTATGLTAILGAIAAGIYAALGLDSSSDATTTNAIASAIVLAVILFVSYLAGGYVAGRMARFAGVKQGVAVWIWGVVVAVVLVIVAAVAGSRFDLLSKAGILPQVGFGDSELIGTVITIVAAIIVTLLGAILGGVAGMRFHRRVDRAGWAQDEAR